MSFVDSVDPRSGASGSKSFGKFAMVVELFWSFRLSGRLASSTVSFRLFSGPPGGCPRACLKAREAPTPAPTTETPVPTTVSRHSTRAEATRRAPTFKIMAWRVDCAALGAPRQHREATTHSSSEVGAGTYHWLRISA